MPVDRHMICAAKSSTDVGAGECVWVSLHGTRLAITTVEGNLLKADIDSTIVPAIPNEILRY